MADGALLDPLRRHDAGARWLIAVPGVGLDDVEFRQDLGVGAQDCQTLHEGREALR